MTAAALLVCCVPASEPAKPAGAIGFRTEPTAASLGEPFVTDDGWTVRVESFALQLRVSGSSVETTESRGYTSDSDSAEYRIASTARAELFARALPVGVARFSVSLQGSYFYSDSETSDSTRIESFGLSPAVAARFRTPADAAPVVWQSPVTYGPSLVLAVRAVKGELRERFDLSLLTFSLTSEAGASLEASGEVRADALTTVPLTVAAEALFRDVRTGRLSFDDVASVDTDRNGTITGDELNATATPSRIGSSKPREPGLLETLVERSSRILSLR